MPQSSLPATETLFRNAKMPTAEAEAAIISDFLVINGKIAGRGHGLIAPENCAIVELEGRLVLPGGIDPHVHFNTPGFEERESFATGSAFAAMGGITTVIDMPCTSLPPVTSVPHLENKLRFIEHQSYVDFALWGGVAGPLTRLDWRAAMRTLCDAGVVGFKTYALSGMPTFPQLTPTEQQEVIGYAAEIGALVGHHAEDADLVQNLTDELVRAGRTDAEAYYLSRPVTAETQTIERAAKITRATQARLHIVHVSTGAGAQLISDYRSSGVDISGETCPHYLAFSALDFLTRGSILKCAPVLKSPEHREQLWQALLSNKLAFVASDHAPCPPAQKQTGSIWSDYGGISGVGTLLPYLYSAGYRQGRLTLARLVEITATAAARRFGLFPRKGTLALDSDADFVVFNEDAQTRIQGADFPSKGKLTPFEGHVFEGRIEQVYLRGNKIYDCQKGLSDTKHGQFIPRGMN